MSPQRTNPVSTPVAVTARAVTQRFVLERDPLYRPSGPRRRVRPASCRGSLPQRRYHQPSKQYRCERADPTSVRNWALQETWRGESRIQAAFGASRAISEVSSPSSARPDVRLSPAGWPTILGLTARFEVQTSSRAPNPTPHRVPPDRADVGLVALPASVPWPPQKMGSKERLACGSLRARRAFEGDKLSRERRRGLGRMRWRFCRPNAR